eukprot:4144050-Prymnesium_polylepis.1
MHASPTAGRATRWSLRECWSANSMGSRIRLGLGSPACSVSGVTCTATVLPPPWSTASSRYYTRGRPAALC